jgi:hypothetical protein
MAGAIIIGQETYYGTWAALRDVFAFLDIYDYSRDYSVMTLGTDVALKSAADGNGLIRADFNKTIVQYPIGNFGVIEKSPSPPAPGFKDYWLRLYWWDAASSPQSTFVPIEVQNQLTGQTVTTSNSVSFTITSALFTNINGEQQFLSLSATNPGVVVSVGKLTPIT